MIGAEQRREPVDTMYLRNRWYVAAWAHELDDGPLGRTILDDPVVLFRAGDGEVAALEDACAHRYVPLSLGAVTDGRIQCPYHGLVYDRAGQCVSVPGQSRVPPGGRVRSYPAVERWRWVWIWPGDPEAADPALIPDFHWNDDPGWVAVGDYFYVKGSWRLFVDNLLDLSHVAYVHASTLGTERVADFPVKTWHEDGHVHVHRWIFDESAPPMFKAVGDFPGKVDRWQMIDYMPPAHFVIDVGCAEAGSGATDGDRSRGVTMFSNHTITPETATTSHYFWHHARNFRMDDAALTDRLRDMFSSALQEDVVAIRAQQRAMNLMPDAPEIDINSDKCSIQTRRLLADRIDAEAAT